MFQWFKCCLDKICRWAQPILGFFLVLCSGFLTFDFFSIKKKYPSWNYQIDLISENIGVAFLAIASINLLLSILDLCLKPSIQGLQKSLGEQKQKNEKFIEKIAYLFQGYALELSRKIQFENDDRITLYVHDKNQTFIRFGRFSQNPEYQKPGRSEYPDSQGCISNGWRSGWCYESDMGGTEQEKIKKAKFYGFETDVYKNIKMKSRFLAAIRVDDEKGNSLAVVVVESLKENRFDETNLKNSLCQEKGFIADLIKNFGEYISMPSDAKSRGL